MDDFNFENEIDEADWSLLDPHYQRDALFVISPELALAEAAEAVAKDEVELVKGWIENGQMARPTEDQVKSWEKSKHEKLANFIIVQPYVLIQLIAH